MSENPPEGEQLALRIDAGQKRVSLRLTLTTTTTHAHWVAYNQMRNFPRGAFLASGQYILPRGAAQTEVLALLLKDVARDLPPALAGPGGSLPSEDPEAPPEDR